MAHVDTLACLAEGNSLHFYRASPDELVYLLLTPSRACKKDQKKDRGSFCENYKKEITEPLEEIFKSGSVIFIPYDLVDFYYNSGRLNLTFIKN